MLLTTKKTLIWILSKKQTNTHWKATCIANTVDDTKVARLNSEKAQKIDTETAYTSHQAVFWWEETDCFFT